MHMGGYPPILELFKIINGGAELHMHQAEVENPAQRPECKNCIFAQPELQKYNFCTPDRKPAPHPVSTDKYQAEG
jgi:hypothetical protein